MHCGCSRLITITAMVDEPQPTTTPMLDEWIGEVGESGVIAAVETLMAAVENGTVPVLRDKDALRAYWHSRRRQRA